MLEAVDTSKVDSEEINLNDWVKQQEHDLFEMDKFIKLGEENNLDFQAIVHLQTACHYLSIARTVKSNKGDLPDHLENLLGTIQQALHGYIELFREHTKEVD